MNLESLWMTLATACPSNYKFITNWYISDSILQRWCGCTKGNCTWWVCSRSSDDSMRPWPLDICSTSWTFFAPQHSFGIGSTHKIQEHHVREQNDIHPVPFFFTAHFCILNHVQLMTPALWPNHPNVVFNISFLV